MLPKKSKIAQSSDNLKPSNVQFINMQIDEDVLGKLQSGHLTDEEKHELVYNILKGHLESQGVKANSHSPTQERYPQSSENEQVLLHGKTRKNNRGLVHNMTLNHDDVKKMEKWEN